MRYAAHAVTLAGGGLVAAGAALIYLPAGLIVAGLVLAAVGLLAIPLDGAKR